MKKIIKNYIKNCLIYIIIKFENLKKKKKNYLSKIDIESLHKVLVLRII